MSPAAVLLMVYGKIFHSELWLIPVSTSHLYSGRSNLSKNAQLFQGDTGAFPSQLINIISSALCHYAISSPHKRACPKHLALDASWPEDQTTSTQWTPSSVKSRDSLPTIPWLPLETNVHTISPQNQWQSIAQFSQTPTGNKTDFLTLQCKSSSYYRCTE